MYLKSAWGFPGAKTFEKPCFIVLFYDLLASCEMIDKKDEAWNNWNLVDTTKNSKTYRYLLSMLVLCVCVWMQITRGLTLELNRLYSLFCSRNPHFEKNGKVSIVSHSLGCVITFDIMTGWDPVRFHHQEVPDPEESKVLWPSEEERHLQEQLRLTCLRYWMVVLHCSLFTGSQTRDD